MRIQEGFRHYAKQYYNKSHAIDPLKNPFRPCIKKASKKHPHGKTVEEIMRKKSRRYPKQHIPRTVEDQFSEKKNQTGQIQTDRNADSQLHLIPGFAEP